MIFVLLPHMWRSFCCLLMLRMLFHMSHMFHMRKHTHVKVYSIPPHTFRVRRESDDSLHLHIFRNKPNRHVRSNRTWYPAHIRRRMVQMFANSYCQFPNEGNMVASECDRKTIQHEESKNINDFSNKNTRTHIHSQFYKLDENFLCIIVIRLRIVDFPGYPQTNNNYAEENITRFHNSSFNIAWIGRQASSRNKCSSAMVRYNSRLDWTNYKSISWISFAINANELFYRRSANNSSHNWTYLKTMTDLYLHITQRQGKWYLLPVWSFSYVMRRRVDCSPKCGKNKHQSPIRKRCRPDCGWMVRWMTIVMVMVMMLMLMMALVLVFGCSPSTSLTTTVSHAIVHAKQQLSTKCSRRVAKPRRHSRRMWTTMWLLFGRPNVFRVGGRPQQQRPRRLRLFIA